jgi:hypothetical protein
MFAVPAGAAVAVMLNTIHLSEFIPLPVIEGVVATPGATLADGTSARRTFCLLL